MWYVLCVINLTQHSYLFPSCPTTGTKEQTFKFVSCLYFVLRHQWPWSCWLLILYMHLIWSREKHKYSQCVYYCSHLLNFHGYFLIYAVCEISVDCCSVMQISKLQIQPQLLTGWRMCICLDSGRRYINRSRRPWQVPEHDGLLGSGSFPKPSTYAAGASAPKFRSNDQFQLNRNNEPYQPPRPYKVKPVLFCFVCIIVRLLMSNWVWVW